MNSFETDLKRAVCARGFCAGLIIELVILFGTEFNSGLFRMSVPVLAALPYATAWLDEYQSGFIKAYLPRCGVMSYIMGKFLACGISGGLLETAGCALYLIRRGESATEISLPLVFASGMLWAVLAAVLAAWSNSRYIAYGGGFVIYYLLVIVHERYFEGLYCLYPYEWLKPSHTWVFDEQGIMLLLGGIILILWCTYYEILGRCLGHV
ncbi:MAG: hypothetical protein HDQ95_16810 [Roseburia sp.]|nr:hypothetical protein [Roseburia sp.]